MCVVAIATVIAQTINGRPPGSNEPMPNPRRHGKQPGVNPQ